jgi:uncharacterized RDD family membrane protein YckC
MPRTYTPNLTWPEISEIRCVPFSLVTRDDGAPLSIPKALGRNIIKVASSVIFPIAMLVVLLSRKRQSIHDRIAKTLVVRER